MSKRVRALTGAVLLSIGMCLAGITIIPEAHAWFGKRKDLPKKTPEVKKETPAVQEAKPVKTEDRALAKIRTMLREKKWTVYITERGRATLPATDILSFSETTFTSKKFASQGYPPSKYKLHKAKNGATAWEAMQMNASQDLVFWRGELKSRVMSGMLHLRPQTGDSSTYDYTTVKPKESPVEMPKEGSAAE